MNNGYSTSFFFLIFVLFEFPLLLLVLGIYFSQIKVPFNVVILSPTFTSSKLQNGAKLASGKNSPSDFSPLSLIAFMFLLSGSKYPPMLLPFSSFFLSKLLVSANSCPNFPSVGKYIPISPST